MNEFIAGNSNLGQIWFAAALAWGFQAQAATTLDLNSSLQSIVQSEREFVTQQLNEFCSESALTLQSPIREFLTQKFFGECIERMRGRSGEKRGFIFGTSPLEDKLRQTLAPYWLTLDMTAEEINLVEREPKNPLFKPLREIGFKSHGVGVTARLNSMARSGVYVIRDFLNALEMEMTLPQERRWKGLSNVGERTIFSIRSAIDHELRRVPPTIPNPSSEVRVWLKIAMTSDDIEIKSACESLLAHFPGEEKLGNP